MNILFDLARKTSETMSGLKYFRNIDGLVKSR